MTGFLRKKKEILGPLNDPNQGCKLKDPVKKKDLLYPGML